MNNAMKCSGAGFIARLFVAFIITTAPLMLHAQVAAPSAPNLNAKGYMLIDFNSGRVLAEKNANERLDPASITKLMTAYAVFRAIKSGQLNLEDEVLVSEKAWRTPGSRMFIEVGKRVPVEKLLPGMRLEFVATDSDADGGNVVEAAIDNLVVQDFSCDIGPGCTGTASVVENSLRAVKSWVGSDFIWEGTADGKSFNLHRTTDTTSLPALWQDMDTSVATVTLPAASDEPTGPAPAHYYRAFGADCAGLSVP